MLDSSLWDLNPQIVLPMWDTGKPPDQSGYLPASFIEDVVNLPLGELNSIHSRLSWRLSYDENGLLCHRACTIGKHVARFYKLELQGLTYVDLSVKEPLGWFQ